MSGFTIPNTPDAFNQNQAEPDSLDFQVLGKQNNGVVSGMAVTPGSGEAVSVTSGEVLINGSYYPYTGVSVPLTGYTSSNFFDIIVARLSGSTITCYAIPGTTGTNPRFPTTVNLDTDVVLAAVWRTGVSAPSSGAITDKRVFVRSNTVRTASDTISAERGSTGDMYVNTAWTPSTTSTTSPLSVKVGSTWYNIAYWAPNTNIATTGTITATTFLGNLTGNVAGNVTGNVTGNLTGTASNASALSGYSASFETAGDSVVVRGNQGLIKGSSVWATGGTTSSFYDIGGTHTYLGLNCMRVLNNDFVYTTQISSGRTVLVNSNGTLGTSASSRKFKENISEYNDVEKRILNTNPVTFDYKAEFIESDSQSTRFNQFGLIAEDLHEAGLTHLVYYDKTNQPEAINYTMLSVELLGIVKQQETAIQNLESRLQALENGAN